MLQILCEDPNYKVQSLDGRGHCELNTSHLYLKSDSLDWMGSRVEVFQSLKQHLSWSPQFHWYGKQLLHPWTAREQALALLFYQAKLGLNFKDTVYSLTVIQSSMMLTTNSF